MSAGSDRARFSRIAHGELPFWNPLQETVLDEWVEALELGPDPRVLDVGCGRGELLLRVLARWGGGGVGVDADAAALELARAAAPARGLAARVRWRAEAFSLESLGAGDFDLALCVGSTHACGDLRAALLALSACVRPGGLLLVADGCWRQEPAPEYLAFLGCEAGAFGTHAANRDLALLCDLDVLASHQTPVEAFRRYEDAYAANLRAWLHAHPHDPEAAAFAARMDRWSAAVARWGLETLGFGMYLLRRPAAA
ncbi:MAG TPA: methyltransferase domain-containing protein [Planctomycetota bacterium]